MTPRGDRTVVTDHRDQGILFEIKGCVSEVAVIAALEVFGFGVEHGYTRGFVAAAERGARAA